MQHKSKRQLFLDHVGQTSTYPLGLEIERAEGIFIYGSDGKKYYDLNSGIAVSSLGHRHPRVIKAIKNQLDLYMHTMVYGEHVQSPQTDYAQLLTTQLDDRLNSIYYLNSGSEVIEAAMKLAKRATGRFEIVACRNAYHGSTQGAESLRSDRDYSGPFLPLLPGIRHISFNRNEDLATISQATAAVIVEPVQAEAGVIPPRNGFLRKLKKKCEETGTLLILDEIQTGFGRTGKLFAHQKYDVIPDVLCIGKAMGGGMPIGGLVAERSLLGQFTRHPDLGHITTFGGHPVACAAARATLEVLLDGKLIEEVAEKEAYIKHQLRHPIVQEVRSSGLLMAVELKKKKYLKHVVTRAFEKGALVDYFLFNRKSFRLAPPLVYTLDELATACNIIMEALDYAQEKYT